jgi:hypothetical protein
LFSLMARNLARWADQSSNITVLFSAGLAAAGRRVIAQTTMLLSLLLVLSSLTAFAHTPDPCEIVLTGSSDQLAHTYFANYAANFEDGLAVRGFMGAAIPNTPANVEIAMDYGLLWWGM